MTNSIPRVLVFSVTLNHYDRIYRRNLASHRRYCERHGYHYVLVREPVWATVKAAVWLKVALLEAALQAGWDWVLFVDADCELRPAAPAVDSVAAPGKALFMAPGFSGNLNSGVILARNTEAARGLFGRVLQAADRVVPEQDWGENGHIIHFARDLPCLKILDRRWNNNAEFRARRLRPAL